MDALDAAPRFEETLVRDTPVQYGNLCTNGSGCSGGRNLLDFINVAIDPAGRAHVAFIDGSYGGSAANSFVLYAQQTKGLALAGTSPYAPGQNGTAPAAPTPANGAHPALASR